MAETFSTEPAKGRQIPVQRKKWPIYEEVIKIFFVCLPELLFCDNTAYGSLISEILWDFSDCT